MEQFNNPTKEQVNEAVIILTGNSFFADDLLPVIRDIYQFIAETKLQYEEECYGTPQDAARYLFALRTISRTIESTAV